MTDPGEAAAIRRTIEAWAQAMRDRDAEAVLSHGAPGMVPYTLAPPLVSQGADRAGLQAWFGTWRGKLGLELPDLAVTAGADIAFCHGLAHMTGTKLDGETVDLWFRKTIGLRRIGDAWKIAHVHESVPFYMDGSYRAATDLRP